jgi:hypothetical protein
MSKVVCGPTYQLPFGVFLKAAQSIVFGGDSLSARAKAKLLTSTAQLAIKTSKSIEASSSGI